MSRSQFAIDVPDSLVARARTGCREAFEQIYRRFERPVFTLALRICGDREAAGDVLQDTMLKLFHHLPDYRGDCPFWGWLRQIAVNEALLRLRRQKRLVAEITVEEDDLPQDQGLPPAAAADAALLQRALEALPERRHVELRTVTRPPSAGTDSAHHTSSPTKRAPSMRGAAPATAAAVKGEDQEPNGEDMPRAYGR